MRETGCQDCDRLWRALEDCTFKLIRSESCLDIARKSYAEQYEVDRLVNEVSGLAARQKEAQAQIARHNSAAHARSVQFNPR